MDPRLVSLKKNFLNGWFPNDYTLFQRDDVPDIDELLSKLFGEAIELYQSAFPALGGRVYTDMDVSTGIPLYLKDIDTNLLTFMGITSGSYYYEYAPADFYSSITGRMPPAELISPYLSEQMAIELYTRIDVDQWSGRMPKPAIMTDSDEDEYILPPLSDFVVFYTRSRIVSIDNIPSNLYKSVEAFLTFTVADYVLDALGKYPIRLLMDEMSSGAGKIPTNRVSSVSISGKLSLGINNGTPDSRNFSDLFNGGSSGKYIDRLKDLSASNKRIFDALKYIRLGGITV